MNKKIKISRKQIKDRKQNKWIEIKKKKKKKNSKTVDIFLEKMTGFT